MVFKTMDVLSARVKHFLDRYWAPYRVLHYIKTLPFEKALERLHLSHTQALSTLILQGPDKPWLLVFPMDRQVDKQALELILGGSYGPMRQAEVNRQFVDCDPGSYPPFGELYGFRVLVDQSVYSKAMVYVPSGSHSSVLCLHGEEFAYLTSNAKRGNFTQLAITTPQKVLVH